MADFALWAAACEPALWPAGTFARAYTSNRRAAIESIIEADPIATCVRTMMANRTMWTGSASDLCVCVPRLLRVLEWHPRDKKPAGARRAPAAMGIEVTFWREGRMGIMIRVSTSAEDTVSTVSIVGTRRRMAPGANPSLLGSETRQDTC